MLLDLLFILSGLVLLYFGADWLVGGSASLALRWGLTPLVVGLTIVAFGTSSPELLVSLQATLKGNGDIALGNVIGSNVANLAFILGLAAVVRAAAVDRQLLRLDVPVVVASTLLLVLFLLDRELNRLEGLLLFSGLLGYTTYVLRKARQGQLATPVLEKELEEELPKPKGKVGRDVIRVVAGLGVLVGGAQLLVEGAVAIAEVLGWSEAFIGLTIVAIGTSLPELATSVVAALRGQGDIAVGNVIGSNLFNVLGILGLTALVLPIQGGGISPFDLGALIGITLLTMVFMWSGWKLVRWEGAILVLCYVGYVFYLLP